MLRPTSLCCFASATFNWTLLKMSTCVADLSF
jgi:hypothetical protein